jgi:hypothetical protein
MQIDANADDAPTAPSQQHYFSACGRISRYPFRAEVWGIAHHHQEQETPPPPRSTVRSMQMQPRVKYHTFRDQRLE